MAGNTMAMLEIPARAKHVAKGSFESGVSATAGPSADSKPIEVTSLFED
jgi:hypothetical protein